MGADVCFYDDYDESDLEIRSDVNETFNTFSKKGDSAFKRWCRQRKIKDEEEFILDISSKSKIDKQELIKS
jgi:hypothetical protein